ADLLPIDPDGTQYAKRPAPAVPGDLPEKWIAFEHYHSAVGRSGSTADSSVFVIHSLLVFLPSLGVLALWTRGWLRRRSIRTGHCRACGYDIRATPGRCPECGTAAGPAA